MNRKGNKIAEEQYEPLKTTGRQNNCNRYDEDKNIHYENNFKQSNKQPDSFYSKNFGNSINRKTNEDNNNNNDADADDDDEYDQDDTCHYGVDASFDLDLETIYKNIPIRKQTQLEESREPDFKEIHILVKISKEEELQIFEKFCESSFSNDTIFALRIIQQNSTNLIVSEIVEYLWLQYKSLNFIVSSCSEDFVLKKLVVFKNEQIVDHHIKFESSGRKKQLISSRSESIAINKVDFSQSSKGFTAFDAKYVKKIKRKM